MSCQKYPDVFRHLTLIKKTFIICTYHIISVIQLSPSRTGSTASYHWIWGRTIILLQNHGLLLTILPSSNLVPHNMICIAWISKRLHTAFDICFFVSIWKTRVLEAPCWLKANNLLYKDIIINLDLLHMWKQICTSRHYQ